MERNRPNLSHVDPEVLSYIQALEAEIERLTRREPRATSKKDDEEAVYVELEPNEPPTTINLITATETGIAKRTPRHLYSRQRRGGMGIFDLETQEDDPPTILATADESDTLLVITNVGRAFRLPANMISETPVHGQGESIVKKMNLSEGEKLRAILPIQSQGYIAIASRTGMVRLLRHHVFGEYMKPGMALFDPKNFGQIAAICWTPGDGDLFIVTRQGRGIRFSEKLIPPQGGLGIRLTDGDAVAGIAGVYEDSGVFLLGADGRGTIRLMEGFNANKAPGAGGKTAMATDQLVGAQTAEWGSDIFIISTLSKIIRFRSDEIPRKEGVVQGVNCMSFRADQASAITVSQTA